MRTRARSIRRTSPRTVTFDPRGGNPYPRHRRSTPGDQLYPGDLRDINNVAPRGGFTWNVGGTGQPGHPRRQRPLLQHSRLEHHLQPAVVQRRADPRELVPERRAARASSQDPTRGRTNEDFVSGRLPAAGAVAARDRARLPDALHVAEHHRHRSRSSAPVWASKPTSRTGRATTSRNQRDPNLFFNPVTGYNRNPAMPAGPIRSTARSSGSSRRAAPTTPRSRRPLNRRYPQQLAGVVSYTLMLFMNDDTTNFQYQGNNPFDPRRRVGALAPSSSGTHPA